MARFKCPSCKDDSISLKQKFLMGWWAITHCPNCDARIAAFPWVLMLISGLHLWNIVWWTGLFVFKGGYIYFVYMAVCWVLIELINLYFNPSATLRKKQPKAD